MLRQLTRVLTVIAFAAATSALAASADYWRWTDANGTIHYGETPPNGVHAVKIRISTGTSSSSANTQPTTDTDQPATSNGPAANTARNSPATAKDHKYCEQAKNNLSVLQHSALVRQTDEHGEQRILSESEKQQQIKLAQDIIKQYCK